MPTLYVSGYGVEVRLEGERIVMKKWNKETEKEDVCEAFVRDIDRAVIAGTPYVSMAVIRRLLREDIPVVYLENQGKWLGTAVPTKNGDVTRRLRQYELSKNREVKLRVSKIIVSRKIGNSRRVLQRLSANRTEGVEKKQVSCLQELKLMMRHVAGAESMDVLRGYEGASAALYFSRLADFFPDSLPFEHRSRRPPHNEANALLSWTYAIFGSEIDSAVRQRGLEVYLGFLHEVSHNTPSLMLDLLEAYRAPVCDMFVLKLLNHKIFDKSDFEYRAEEGGVFLKRETRKRFFIEYEKNMERMFKMSQSGRHMSFRTCVRDDVLGILRFLETEDEQDLSFFKMI